MARPRIYDQNIRTEMRKLFAEGLTPPRVAVVLNCSAMTVYRELGFEPFERREHRHYPRSARKKKWNG